MFNALHGYSFRYNAIHCWGMYVATATLSRWLQVQHRNKEGPSGGVAKFCDAQILGFGFQGRSNMSTGFAGAAYTDSKSDHRIPHLLVMATATSCCQACTSACRAPACSSHALYFWAKRSPCLQASLSSSEPSEPSLEYLRWSAEV